MWQSLRGNRNHKRGALRRTAGYLRNIGICVVAWWRRNDRRYGVRWRLSNGLTALLLVFSVVVPVMQSMLLQNAYELSADTHELVGSTDAKLAKLLTYDAQQQLYQFNKDAVKSSDMPPELQRQSVGTPGDKGSATYALDVPTDMSKGVTYHDTNSNLDFSLIPQFKASVGQQVDGHIVFPMSDGMQAIYTLKNNGLKEDIIVPKAGSDTMRFSYRLQLPDSLEAKSVPGSGGAVGIYSADPALFGDISYGSDTDRQNVEIARKNADKTYLVFGIPAPVINATDGGSTGSATARFELTEDSLTVVAEGMKSVKGPVTVDPSVTVTSTSDFQLGGNNEGMIDFSASGQVTRGGLTGGSVGAWNTTNAFSTERVDQTTVAYNGYMYMLGGYTSSNGGGTSSKYASDVQYAPINADGTLGTWQATTSFATARSGHSTLAYNGYMYILAGGRSTSSFLNDVQYAPINADGTLGTWQATTSFATARQGAPAITYDGYMYIMGGKTSGGVENDVQYAPINADGTLGTWQATTSFATARQDFESAARNGFVYIIAGDSDSTNLRSDVQYAPINADGTLGTWQATTSLSIGIQEFSATVYNGYLYILGGEDNNDVLRNSVQYAQINANGTIGAWQSTTNLPAARQDFSSTAYNGYLYMFGGVLGSGAITNDVRYAKIDPAGATTTFGTTSQIGAVRALPCSVAYNGYIYVIGGSTSDSGSNNTTTVYRATINADGTIGTYGTVTALPQAKGSAGCTVANGYLYVVGGYTGTSSNSGTVRYVKINSNGTLASSWSNGTTLPSGNVGRVTVSYTAGNGTAYLYEVGSSLNGASNRLVHYASLNAGTGAVGSWNSTSSLISNYRDRYVTITNGRIYAYGGFANDDVSVARADVEYAAINNNGSLAAWQSTTAMPTAITSGTGVTVNGCIYQVGGQIANYVQSAMVQYACPSTDGSISNWNINQSLSSAATDVAASAYAGFIYAVGGNNTSGNLRLTQYAAVNNGGSGTVGGWSTNTSFTTGRYAHTSVAYNGYLYVLGGYSGNAYLNDVQYAPINANGTVGAWAATTSFPNSRYAHTSIVYNGYLYVMGGHNGSTYLNDVQYAPINANGTVGAWAATTNSTTARNSHTSVVYNGYLYVLGGYSGSSNLNDVQYAPINANGTVGAWAATTSFTTGRSSHTSVVYNGYIYVIGGYSNIRLNDVQYAPINANGTVGAWAATTSFTTARNGHASIVYNGYLYVMGGWDGTTEFSDVQYAPINANGTLGDWTTTTSLTTGRDTHAVAIYRGYLYATGGYDTTYQNYVQYAPLNMISREGKYSKLVDLGMAANITNISYTGTLRDGYNDISVRVAGTDGILGSNPVSTAITSTACSSSLPSVRYLMVSVELDDAQTGVFSDSSSILASLQDVTITYKQGHPAPDVRLRGGKTLQENAGLSPLDTCGDTASSGGSTGGSGGTGGAETYALGDTGPAGGIIVYDKSSFSDGWRYLEAAPNYDSSKPRWGCASTDIAGANGTAIGTGKQNTAAIVTGCADAGTAAKVADDYVLNGYSDWFLPSKDELTQVYLRNSFFSTAFPTGIFGYFWSSSDLLDGGHAYIQILSSGGESNGGKNSTFYILPIRQF